MKHTTRRSLGLGVSALLFAGLTTVATPAYANGFTITASTATVAYEEEVVFTTSAPDGKVFAFSIDGQFEGYGDVAQLRDQVSWSDFGGCEDVNLTISIFDQDYTDSDFGLEVPPSDEVSVTFLAGALLECGPESMTLTGDARIGSTVTATALVPRSLVGAAFDLWVCPDTTIRPRDNQDDNGDCRGPFIQENTGDSTVFVLGYDPVRDDLDDGSVDVDAQEFWAEACGKFFIVHDFSDGAHSNWIGPVVCTTATAPDAAAPTLAATGATSIAGIGGLAAALALLVGGGLLVATRRRNALSAE